MPNASAVIPPEEVRRQQEAAINAATAAAEARKSAELAIVTEIVKLAKAKNALQDLAAIEDVTIPSLTRLAVQYGVSTDEWNALITTLTPLQWHLLAIVGGSWADCWQDLKGRFPEYLQELQQASQEE